MDKTITLQAGTAKREITTTEAGVRINDPLWAKALVLKSGEICAVIVTLDALAIGGIGDIDDEFLPLLRQRLQTRLGIPPGHVMVSASHTHPPGRILCDGGELLDRVFAAVEEAQGSLQPVHAGAGAGREAGISMNRNLIMEDGSHWTIRHAHPGPPADAVRGVNPIDPEIGVIRLNRLDGRPLAIIYNFACHLLFADTQGSVTANLPGIASSMLEQHFGDGAMAFFLQGAAGDVVDVGFKDFSRPRDITPLGNQLGQSTLGAVRKIETRPGILKVVAATVQLPRRTDSAEKIAAKRKEQAELLTSLRFTSLGWDSFLPLYLSHSAGEHGESGASCPIDAAQPRCPGMEQLAAEKVGNYLAGIRAMERLAKIADEIATLERHMKINQEGPGDTVPAEVVGLRIGDATIISAPLELLTQVGLNLKAASPFSPTLVAAFTNGYLHYGAPAQDYEKGGYEVTECLLAPEWQRIYEGAAREILGQLEMHTLAESASP